MGIWKWRIALAIIIIVSLMAGVSLYLPNAHLKDSNIRISTNPWVGFTPFIYAQEKGWLDRSPFKFSWQVDLSENARLYERGLTQGFTATQYEMLHLKDASYVRPILLIDRSFGADAILSNYTLEELRSFKQPIKVYLELGSLNEDFFHAFVTEYKLNQKIFTFINSNQNAIATIERDGEPKIIISYAPYLSGLMKKFKVLASTQTLNSFFVIDALFIDERFVVGRQADFQHLQTIFNRAKHQLDKDPHEYFAVIEPYLEGQSYEEFIASTHQIEWVNQENSAPLIRQLNKQKVLTDQLLP